MKTFEQFDLSQALVQTIEKLGYTEPTQIQAQSIPLVMDGEDVIGESATGSGKTLAFGCGIIEKVIPKQGLQALVLAPTRELACQVSDNLKQLAGRKLFITTVYGGVSMEPQVQALKKAEVVVATPGRMLDHLDHNTVNLSKISLLVLDEADRMLEMGFIEDVEQIINACPTDRQTLFFSATMEQRIRDLASKYMHHPKRVSAKSFVDPSKLRQVYYDTPRNLKLSLLVHLLREEKSDLVMVFCNTRKGVDMVTKSLRAAHVRATAIHGGLSQNKRTRTLDSFHDGKVSVLVCTDVAARGLHIENVTHVYNYDIPKDPEDYVHRIGRTARAGNEGEAINILCDYDHANFGRVQDKYRDFRVERIDLPYVKKVALIQPQQTRGRRPQQRRRFVRR